jgi:hypothetical protein
MKEPQGNAAPTGAPEARFAPSIERLSWYRIQPMQSVAIQHHWLGVVQEDDRAKDNKE